MSSRGANISANLRALRKKILAEGRRSFRVVGWGLVWKDLPSWVAANNLAKDRALRDAPFEREYHAQEISILGDTATIVRSRCWCGYCPKAVFHV